MKYNLILAENQRIEGERILLRPVELTDAPDMHEYASDEETTKFVFLQHRDEEATKENIVEFFMANPIGKYAIVYKENNKMIGTMAIRVDEANLIAEIGYVLNKDYWGRGIMTEAGNLMLQLSFEKLELEKVYARHDVENPASGKVMLRLGMQREGILRSHQIHKGKRIDFAFYGILREEYFRNQLEG